MEHMPYHVTTPLMHGPGIKRIQQLLINKGFLGGKADGVYGVHTAQAVYRCKFWLGYLKPDQVAGLKFLRLLSGQRKPGPAMRLIATKRQQQRKRRIKRHKGLTKGQRVLQKACSQLGQTEHPPNSNISKFSNWYGLIGPWCAMFCTWCSVDIRKGFKKGSFVAYVPYLRAKAVLGQDGFMVTAHPVSGDYICYDWQHDGTADHVGIYAEENDLRAFVPKAFQHAVNEFGNLGGGDFWAVEGNTGVGNDSNGGITMIRKRNRTLVQTFVRAS